MVHEPNPYFWSFCLNLMFLDMVECFFRPGMFIFSLGFFLMEAKFLDSNHHFGENTTGFVCFCWCSMFFRYLQMDPIFTISHRYIYFWVGLVYEKSTYIFFYCLSIFFYLVAWVESAIWVLIWNCKYLTVVCDYQS